MTPAELDLARRAVACPRWRWLPGMRYRLTYRFGDGAEETSDPARVEDWAAAMLTRDGFHVPDLTDPATSGCLLALVREVWGEPGIACVELESSRWRVVGVFRDAMRATWRVEAPGDARSGATEAEALVAALEAAP